MANLLAVLSNSAGALNAYDQVLQVTQNNVANASTPGYAEQSLPLQAMAFDPSMGLPGGVQTGQLQSARDEYAEQAVRQQNTALGSSQQLATSLQSLQSIFDISGNTGIPLALNQFFTSASAWAQNPDDTSCRQAVINRAGDLAQSFNSAANQLQTLAQNTQTQLQSTVDQVNQLVGQIATYNRTLMESGRGAKDMGMDAQVHSTLEELSQYVNFTATEQPDGTTTILLNGSTPLLIGGQQYAISVQMVGPPADAANPSGPPAAQLTAADGTDITAQTTEGQLGALLNMSNSVLPSYMGDANQAGSLNEMAQQFADRVNGLLTSGNLSDGPPPVPGVPLFDYDATDSTDVAATLTVDPAVTPDQLAAIDPGPPEASNGIPLTLSGMATPTNDDDMIDGVSYSEFYGQMAANAGSQLQAAQNNQQVDQSLLAQARNQRQQLSGVSLDQEAMTLVEFQRAYEATARMITVLDQLTLDTINILPTS